MYYYLHICLIKWLSPHHFKFNLWLYLTFKTAQISLTNAKSLDNPDDLYTLAHTDILQKF